MKDFWIFDKEIFNIFFEYIKQRYKFKNLNNGFIIRKVGKTLRLHYAIDDLIDWWDIDMNKNEIENMLKNEVYYKAIFKNILEFSNIKNILDNLSIKPKNITFSKVYYINLKELNSEEKIIKSLSYNQRRNLKKYQNRLNKIKYEFFKASSFKSYFNEIIFFIRKRHENNLNIWNDELFCNLMFKALDYFENLNMLDVFIMKNEDNFMSANITIKFNNRVFWWITALNESYYYFSPSRISVWFMLKHYLSEKFIEFNFMRGESEYKTLWTDKFYKLYRYEFENPNIIKRWISLFKF